jgi:alpha-1,2-mannosyltransferase
VDALHERAAAVARAPWLPYVLATLAIVAWGAFLVGPAWNAPGYDLSALLVGAKVIEQGHAAALYAHNPTFYNLADGPEFLRAAGELGFAGDAPTAFVHSPLVAYAALPLTQWPFDRIMHAWVVASAIATVAGVGLTLYAYAPRWRASIALPLVMLALVPFEPIRYALWLGQTTPFVFLCLVGGVALVRSGRPLAGGLVLSLAAYLKLTPLVFLLLWAWQRRWGAVLGLAIGFGALCVLSITVMGMDSHVAFVHRIADIARITLVSFNNHSVSAFLTRPAVAHDEVYRFLTLPPTPLARFATLGVAGVLVAAPATMLRDDRQSPLGECFAFLFMLLVPSISWTHYFVLLVPCAAAAWSSPERGRSGRVLACALLCTCMRPILGDNAHLDRDHGLMLAGPTLGALGFALLALVLAFRRRQTILRAP